MEMSGSYGWLRKGGLSSSLNDYDDDSDDNVLRSHPGTTPESLTGEGIQGIVRRRSKRRSDDGESRTLVTLELKEALLALRGRSYA